MSNPTRVYIAAPWKHKEQVKEIREQVRQHGYVVTSSWLDLPDSGDTYEKAHELMAKEAQQDLDDVQSSDFLLYLNLAKSEGKATELGWALALGLPVYVVGGMQGNVFLHLPEIMHIDSVEAFFERD